MWKYTTEEPILNRWLLLTDDNGTPLLVWSGRIVDITVVEVQEDDEYPTELRYVGGSSDSDLIVVYVKESPIQIAKVLGAVEFYQSDEVES